MLTHADKPDIEQPSPIGNIEPQHAGLKAEQQLCSKVNTEHNI